MTKLTNAQDAIQQAIEGGYTPHTHIDKCDWSPVDHHLSDPLFWKALGRARGLTGVVVSDNIIGYQNTWQGYTTVWFETRLSNGDETKFWESLP
jgi:hypothetical protein